MAIKITRIQTIDAERCCGITMDKTIAAGTDVKARNVSLELIEGLGIKVTIRNLSTILPLHRIRTIDATDSQ
jgi:hypothetical protein